ncbi:MAG: hypothetical protein CVU61_15455 [Deltaproteobacteria bacterium HGW-Deltaproteobacteria-19]|nr:MAG: hypothetical protein CVU61_15455 [Deltaproteobacteria bacterium HGW-Deltaproteobacteria-19]
MRSAKVAFTLADGSELVGRVVKIEDHPVTVDGNHPRAGRNLIFEIRVVDIGWNRAECPACERSASRCSPISCPPLPQSLRGKSEQSAVLPGIPPMDARVPLWDRVREA